ncbi:MAG: PD40 domain-containing protein, partial [Acidobacteriaceae bacterium]|nr:PD40 domain-containing protein [Acidobacteriaceae bacterium]
DGKRIAFESNRSGAYEIWVARTDGTGPMQLTSFGRDTGSPHWSPDGRWIAFDTYMSSGGWDIWIVDSEGGKLRRLTNGEGISHVPSFSRDGKWIYFGNDRTGRWEVCRIPFGGGAAMQVTHRGASIPQESTDGQVIYYLKTGNPRGGVEPLYETSASGIGEHALGIMVADRAFQVVGNGIYFISPAGNDDRGREIRFYQFATHRTRIIQALGDVRSYLGFSVSPDRRTFLYTVVQHYGSNLMLMEKFR